MDFEDAVERFAEYLEFVRNLSKNTVESYTGISNISASTWKNTPWITGRLRGVISKSS